MKHFGLWAAIALVVSVFAISCDDEPEEDALGHDTEHTIPENNATISTDFTTNVFTFGQEEELLKELKLCDPKAPNDEDELHPSCSPKFFRFFKLNDQKDLKDGFILLVKAGVNGMELRRVLIFEREKGLLVKLNGFYGNLIETRPTESGYPDLVIRFSDNIEGSLAYYNCLFQWNGSQYGYKLCEAIQEGGQEAPHRIKREYIDSMAPEIEKILIDNNMLF
jgi:hypothetical protein